LDEGADPNPEVGREDGSLFILLLLYQDQPHWEVNVPRRCNELPKSD
jgi:hypothetical protein